jgi:hypothetical protein
MPVATAVETDFPDVPLHICAVPEEVVEQVDWVVV